MRCKPCRRRGNRCATSGYDANGDTTSITTTGGINTSLGYDAQARLTHVALANGTIVTIDYNANGQRSHYTASVPGQPTLTETFGYRGNELGQAVVVRGTQVYTDTYIYSPNGTPLELLRQQGTGTSRYWYVLDGRGNVTALTNVSGKIVDFYTYDVWGRPTTTYETVAQPLRYGGYWYDREMGWYWAGVRSYDPTLKRWLQPDPSRIDGARTYAYAADNPIDEVDPSGFAPHQSSGLLGLAVSHFGQIAASFQALRLCP